MAQRAQDAFIGVALPDAVEMPHGQIDDVAVINFLGDVVQYAVPEINGVVQPDQGHRRAVAAGLVFEEPFARKTGTGVFAEWFGRGRLGGTAAIHGHQRIHAAGRERDKFGVSISLRGIRWHQCVHCPCESGIVFGAEFLANEINDIFTVRQFRPNGCLREIRSVRLHAVILQPLPGGIIGIAADGDNLQRVSGQIRRVLGQHGQCGAHLAAGPEDHQRTIHLRNEIAQVREGWVRAASSAASSRMISGGAVIMD